MQVKTWLTLALGLAVLLSGGFLSYSIYSKLQRKHALQEFLHRLPAFQFTALDSTQIGTDYIPTGQTAVLLFFSPDCEYCQAQAKAIGEQLSIFKNVQFLWISDDQVGVVRAFAERYGLNRKINSTVVTAPYGQIKNVFGVRQLPSTLIYDEQHRFVRQFSGETKWEAIFAALHDRAPVR